MIVRGTDIGILIIIIMLTNQDKKNVFGQSYHVCVCMFQYLAQSAMRMVDAASKTCHVAISLMMLIHKR